ncbi:glucose 1-dehydrogenase [Palleronia sp. LCG004]|uniref:SDR family NAD(P)-dependent oxidoreductase n=1 Tax=Palleronia sp. LCG004 TaxID=3079304 RepID=UPI002941D524|nr:glucose 1-dehydrogenase [Palleronia sp. LCG004]WOI56579.1 SDR family oxidoreductase [Palleronia sp. LCG004]
MTVVSSGTGRLSGKRALVTGAANGIGRAIARRFVSEGAKVFATDITWTDEDRHALPGARIDTLDVALEAEWQRIVSDIEGHCGGLDILVNNAGIGGGDAPIHTTSLDAWHRAHSVNLDGVFLGMKHAVPLMRLAGGGAIVNMGSIWGVAGTAGSAAYQSSKGAVSVLTRNGAITYAPENIRVNAIHPGLIATPMTASQPDELNENTRRMTPLGHPGTPDDIAAGALYLASDEAAFVTGAELAIDGGFLAQ